MRALSFSVLALILVTACGNANGPQPAFRSTSTSQGDFTVIPADELQVPPSLTLPTPTPGGVNRADP